MVKLEMFCVLTVFAEVYGVIFTQMPPLWTLLERKSRPEMTSVNANYTAINLRKTIPA